MFLFGRKKQDLIEDIQKYLKIEDLDDLAKHYVFMRGKHGIKTIQKYVEGLKPPLEYQALVNMLFHPDVMDVRARLIIQKAAIKNEFGEYALLAAVVGLQGLELEKNTTNDFVQAILMYLQTVIANKQTDKFTLVVAGRITNTLLCLKTNLILDEKDAEILLSILRNGSYKSIHHNIILCILKFCPEYINETKRKTIEPSIYEEIVRLRDLQEKKQRGDITAEERIQIGQLYCYIPNLNALTFQKED